MERQFSARFDIISYTPVNANTWNIVGYVIDNSGNFFAASTSVGDIVYLDGSMLGLQVLRYKVKEIDLETVGTQLYGVIEWDMGSDDPIDPYVGLAGIIGKSTDKLKIASLPSVIINTLDESFINSIKNYENVIMIDNLAKIDSPEFIGKPLTPTAESNSNDNQIANTEWVNSKIDTIDGIHMYTASEDISAFKVVYIDDNDSIGLADSRNKDHSDKIVGVSLESKLVGEQVKVMLKGELAYDQWNFEKTGQLVFVGRRGDITLDPSTITGFIQQIGIIAGKHDISLDIEEAVLLE